MSKKAIMLVHKGKLEKAEDLLVDVFALLSQVKELPSPHKDLAHTGAVDSGFQEYTEAKIFLSLVADDQIPSKKQLQVPSSSYLLGLADVVGELRRRTLDILRTLDIEKAEKTLRTMESIYDELILLDEAFHSLPSLRRKCDVARRVIEATRGDVTVAFGRNSLETSIEDLNRTIKNST
ncbi:MAG: haloacid dehalogenase [Candidatus Bathyarchaeota archaeon]|nr:MAG: haloacid dehalogenase [Candidatus Bathyarchaeota archaeon]